MISQVLHNSLVVMKLTVVYLIQYSKNPINCELCTFLVRADQCQHIRSLGLLEIISIRINSQHMNRYILFYIV